MPEASDHRLPRSVIPERYELVLAPDLQTCRFEGEASVRVQVVEEVSEVVLNALDLAIHEAELVGGEGRVRRGTVTLDAEHARAVIQLDQPAEPGEWTLRTRFAGELNDKLRGFYRSTFRDDDGAERVIATTQFESTDARRAFPCWDEPDLKAVFSVTLVVDEHLTALSNARALRETPLGDGKKRVEFADTMRMSTYLVAFVVGPLEVTEPVDVDGVPLRVACVPGKRHLAAFALDVGAHSLRFFREYFGIPYPGDKLDLVALPDFAFGAMENLGCVTFRETALLVDTDTASRVELERVADVVAHEIAHMWFGDLVTMKWWNGIWLNEAFATFMELLCVDAYRPEWERWVTFSTSRAAAMFIDGLASTRPVEYPVVRPEDAEGMFDVLTYQKGGAVLRMLERYLGAEPFRQGIARYLAEHSYANTETTDLWDAIEAASGEPVRSTMDSWIFQGGYPLLSAQLSAAGTEVELRQARFRYPLDGRDAHGEDPRWQVPVLVRAGVGDDVEHRRVLLAAESARVTFGGKADWVVVNAGGWGFYRVRYSSPLLQALTTGMFERLDAIERFNLVNDTWAAVLSGLSPVTDFVELVRPMSPETDPSVWQAVLSPLGLFDRMLDGDARAGLHTFVRGLVGPAFERVGWHPRPGESEKTGTLRATLLQALGTLGADEAVRARAHELHAAYLTDRRAIPGDLVSPVVSVLAQSGGEGEYTTFLQRHREADTPQEEVRYLWCLAEFPVRPLVQRTLDLALGEVRTQNAPFLIGLALTNRDHGDLAWRFVVEHWDEILAKFPDNAIPRMLDGIASLPPEVADDVAAFLHAHPLRAGEKLVEQAVERLQVHTAFWRRSAAEVAEAFSSASDR